MRVLILHHYKLKIVYFNFITVDRSRFFFLGGGGVGGGGGYLTHVWARGAAEGLKSLPCLGQK